MENKVELKKYGECDYFKAGWHFRILVCFPFDREQHFWLGFHKTNPFWAILKTKFIE